MIAGIILYSEFGYMSTTPLSDDMLVSAPFPSANTWFNGVCPPFGRYDVKSVPPRQVEVLLVDPLRLRDPTEVRRILRGHSDLSDDEDADETVPPTGAEGDGEGDENDTDAREPRKTRYGDSMPELLSLLSRAVEEEIRGSKGLFGLETGVLERLKGGGRVTSFLRHGSVRRHDSAGAAPHGLAAGGMKKWWRCPRCHISQVCVCVCVIFFLFFYFSQFVPRLFYRHTVVRIGGVRCVYVRHGNSSKMERAYYVLLILYRRILWCHHPDVYWLVPQHALVLRRIA